MRHEALKDREKFDTVDVAAVWPASAQIAPLPIPELTPGKDRRVNRGALAAPDVPVEAGVMIAASYGLLLLTLALATVASAKAVFAIVIAAFFLLMFFAVPAVFLGIDSAGNRGRSFSDFIERGMETLTGRCGGAAALVQMLVVPVLLTIGAVCIGIAASIIV